jgi:signal peptidase I
MPLFGKKEKVEKKKETLSESIAGMAGVLVSALFIITFLVQSFVIPSGSMENTLLIGDHVFVDRLAPTLKAGYVGPLLAYREIHRGDIIVFVHPATPDMYVVKRVIGIPGDRIHLHDGVVYRNGEALQEPYTLHLPGDEMSRAFRDEFPRNSPPPYREVPPEWTLLMRENTKGEDLVVPEGDYFGMGDNRNNSLDSRFWGFIPRQNIVGRPMFIYWSFDSPPERIMVTSLADRAGSLLYTVIHFFDRTRWRRMFHLVR